jgi:hypothetical protein
LHRRRAGAGALIAVAHDVMAESDGFYARPVDGVAELVHEIDEAVFVQAVGQARSAKFMLRKVLLGPMLISGVVVIETSGR